MKIEDILSEINIAKRALQRIQKKVKIKKILLILTFSFIFLFAFVLMYSKETSFVLNLEGNSLLEGEFTKLTILICLLSGNIILFLVDVIKKEDSEALSYLSKFIYEAELNRSEYKIRNCYIEASKYFEELDEHKEKKDDAPVHSKREQNRQIVIYVGVLLLTIIVFVFAFFLSLTAYQIALIGIWLGFLLTLLEYLNYQYILKKKNILFHCDNHRKMIKFEKDNYKAKIACRMKILNMTYSRYSSYLLALSVANIATNAFTIIINILDLSGIKIDKFFRIPSFLDAKIVTSLLMAVSIVFLIMMLFLKDKLVNVMVRITILKRDNILYTENPTREAYEEWIIESTNDNIIIKELDIARGKHEYNVCCVENMEDIGYDELYKFNDRRETHLPRLYLLWLTEGLSGILIFLEYQTLTIFLILLVSIVFLVITEYYIMEKYLAKKYKSWIILEKDLKIKSEENNL